MSIDVKSSVKWSKNQKIVNFSPTNYHNLTFSWFLLWWFLSIFLVSVGWTLRYIFLWFYESYFWVCLFLLCIKFIENNTKGNIRDCYFYITCNIFLLASWLHHVPKQLMFYCLCYFYITHVIFLCYFLSLNNLSFFSVILLLHHM